MRRELTPVSLVQLEQLGQKIAKAVHSMIPKGTTFVLVLCGRDGWATFLTNAAERDDAVAVMKELVETDEAGKVRDPVPTAQA